MKEDQHSPYADEGGNELLAYCIRQAHAVFPSTRRATIMETPNRARLEASTNVQQSVDRVFFADEVHKHPRFRRQVSIARIGHGEV